MPPRIIHVDFHRASLLCLGASEYTVLRFESIVWRRVHAACGRLQAELVGMAKVFLRECTTSHSWLPSYLHCLNRYMGEAPGAHLQAMTRSIGDSKT